MDKKILGILLIGLLGINMYAATPLWGASQPASPVAEMTSVNGTSYMSTGSDYSSEVYDVGSESPSKIPVRKAPPTVTPGTPTSETFDNPQQGPIGDAVLPLMLMAAAGAGFIALRRRRAVIGK